VTDVGLPPLNYLSFCTGGGGLDLGLELAVPGARAVCLVERECFAIAHLVSAMEAGLLAPAPVWTDARTFNGRPWRGAVDGVIGGIPCQPHSVAGNRLAEEDERDLWAPFRRAVVQSGAWFVLIENVEGMLSSGGGKKVATTPHIRARDVCPHCNARRVDDHQIGLEATPEEFVEKLAWVFREAFRTLRADGTLWLNIGESAASSGGMGRGENTFRVGRRHQQRNVRGSKTYGLKRKDKIGVPWMLATALRDGFYRCETCEAEHIAARFPVFEGARWCMDCLIAGRPQSLKRTFRGWFLREEIIWNKPNCMPSSVKDAPTRAHEQIFLLAKSRHYFYDAEAIAEKASPNTHARVAQDVDKQAGSKRAHGGTRADRPMKAVVASPKAAAAPARVKANADWQSNTSGIVHMRNRRTVWTVPTVGYTDSHFATFPPALIEPCILAGAPKGGVVLDPFGGSGTVAQVAARLGRSAIVIDLNPDCRRMTEARLKDLQLELVA
jgi:hypothetical protein